MRKKKQSWLWYFIYAVVFLCYIIFSSKLLVYLQSLTARTFKLYTSWSIVIFVVLGLLLGLEKLLSETRKEGKWKVNLPKILFLGIPSLYFSMSLFFYISHIDFFDYLIPMCIQSNISSFMPIFQVILGFTLITSFVKVKE